jgi:hypothetical protein
LEAAVVWYLPSEKWGEAPLGGSRPFGKQNPVSTPAEPLKDWINQRVSVALVSTKSLTW